MNACAEQAVSQERVAPPSTNGENQTVAPSSHGDNGEAGQSAPSTNGDNGRDSCGRFAKGNDGGPGNPFARKAAALRAALFNKIT